MVICFKAAAIRQQLVWDAEDGVGEHMVGPGVLPSPDGIVFAVSCCLVWLCCGLFLIDGCFYF
jgi:hypothetical protein